MAECGTRFYFRDRSTTKWRNLKDHDFAGKDAYLLKHANDSAIYPKPNTLAEEIEIKQKLRKAEQEGTFGFRVLQRRGYQVVEKFVASKRQEVE